MAELWPERVEVEPPDDEEFDEAMQRQACERDDVSILRPLNFQDDEHWFIRGYN